MVISHALQYVYVGIPRTGSKSMINWLIAHFDGKHVGKHHQYQIPEEVSDYLIFTTVRNPYDRWISGHFAASWSQLGKEIHIPKDSYNSEIERQKLMFNALSNQERIQNARPRKPELPLQDRIKDVALMNESDDPEYWGLNQKRYVERANANLILYFERFPDCVSELPFVDQNSVPPFPHYPERGVRPPGDFFDHHPDEWGEEEVVWAYESETFEAFGYRRFDCGLPNDAPNAKWLD